MHAFAKGNMILQVVTRDVELHRIRELCIILVSGRKTRKANGVLWNHHTMQLHVSRCSPRAIG